jgi:hypothetical protein
MDLELEAAGSGGNGTRAVSLSVDSPTAELGRGDLGGSGGPSQDRTVSRRHVSLRLLGVGDGIAFEVVGRNPVVVRSPDGGGGGGSGTSRVFRRGEKGELRAGDALSLSLKAPAFWAVRAREGNGDGDADVDVEPAVLDAVARRERRTRERKERERERRVAEETMEVTEEEEGAAVDSDVEGFDIDLAAIDPVRGDLLFFSAFPGRVKMTIFHIPLQS